MPLLLALDRTGSNGERFKLDQNQLNFENPINKLTSRLFWCVRTLRDNVGSSSSHLPPRYGETLSSYLAPEDDDGMGDIWVHSSSHPTTCRGLAAL